MTPPKSAQSRAAEEKLFAIIRDIGVGMLTTVQADGHLHSRPMVTRWTEPRGDPFFFVTDDAPMIGEMRKDHHVAVAYADPRRQLYACVAGQASLVRDRKQLEALWTPSLITWFPQGLNEPGLALLRVKIQTGEFWDAPSRTVVEIVAAAQDAGLNVAPADELGDHQKLEM